MSVITFKSWKHIKINHKYEANAVYTYTYIHTQFSINQKISSKNVQLQVTGLVGAVGKDQFVFLNSGEVKRVLMGSFAIPESPNPWSHKMKLRAIESGLLEDGFGWKTSMNKRVPLRVSVRRTIGLVNRISFIIILDHSWSFAPGNLV